jgi:uncharacterized membrane protein
MFSTRPLRVQSAGGSDAPGKMSTCTHAIAPRRFHDGDMNNTPTAPAAPEVHLIDRRTPITPSQSTWLAAEVGAWRAAGVITHDQSTAILSRYRTANRFNLAKLMLTLGSAFIGFGVIWLVAANLDELPPLARFITVAVIWLAFLVLAEYLAGRRAHGGMIPSPVVGAFRILATLTFGAVIFQAAQSMQVPAFEPSLVGYWSIGALVYGYTVRSLGAVVIGMFTGVGWYVAQVAFDQPSALGVVLALLTGGVIAIGWGVVQERWREEFSTPWREAGVALLLVGLFAAAIPSLDRQDFEWQPALIAGIAVAALAAAAGGALGLGRAKLEPVAGVLVTLIGVGLVLWEAGNDPDNVDAAAWLHAAVSVGAYVIVAAAVAALGVLRDSGRLTALATLALVVFTTFQSFAVFAQIIQGAWLFVFLGLIFLATGYAFDRARRRLAESLEAELNQSASTTTERGDES